jgi:hypothetical protein
MEPCGDCRGGVGDGPGDGGKRFDERHGVRAELDRGPLLVADHGGTGELGDPP